MSMFNDIVWDAKGNDELCVNNSKTIEVYTHSVSHAYFSHTFFMRAHTCMAQVVCCAHVVVHLTFSVLMFHPSLLLSFSCPFAVP